MSGSPSSPSRFRDLFEIVLQDYEKQTGIALANHPLAEQLQNCHTVESITAVFQDQARAFTEFRGSNRIMKSLKSAVSVLCTISATADLGEAIGHPFPPAKAINAGLAILLAAIKGVSTEYDALVDLLESIEHFLKRLDIYTKIPPTAAMTEMVLKIMMELISTLALATKQIKQGRSKKFVKNLFGEHEVEAVLQRLDRLTQDEARATAAQTLNIVYGLVQNMKVVMDDGKASVDSFRNALELLQQISSDMNRSKRDRLQQEIRYWLSPPDPWKNHNIACKSRYKGTTTWFIRGDSFPEWKSSGQGSVLWVHGKPGAGKSVLCSKIVEDIDIMRRSGLASLAFFYCDFREDQKKDKRGLLSSLLFQLCDQSDSYCDILSDLYSTHRRGAQSPSDEALARCLQDILKLPKHPPVYLIVDALDECPNTSARPSPREEVLELVKELIESRLPNLRICVTSRPEADITIVLDPLTFRSVSLHDESGQAEDINDYIKSVVVTDPRNRRWKMEDKQLVIDFLTKKADGMFRWVYCQEVYLRGCLPGRLRRALADLPETLDKTYERALREINNADWEFAHRLLQCVAVASRPLRVEELAEFLAFDFDAESIPKFHEDWRLEDPVDAVLSTCPSLLAMVNVNGSRFIQFSHFSVKEFLMSTRLAEASDTISRRYQISMTSAHTLVAQACLGTLLHLDENVTSDSLDNFPLAEYAAEHWVGHAQFENVSQNLEDGMKLLFDPTKRYLAIWIWIHNPALLPWERAKPGGKPSTPRGTPLHYAAICGLHTAIKFLISEQSEDVHSHDFEDRWTPLHMASRGGHVKFTRMLLELGAVAIVQDKSGSTPLHWASGLGHVEVVRILLERDADVMAQDDDESTPLHWASRSGHIEIARILLERGADAMAQNNGELTPLHWASRSGHAEIVRMLLDRGANTTAQDFTGSTALHLASRLESAETARLLLEWGADVAARNMFGWTPLHEAARLGRLDIARMLSERGADATARDKHGTTPLHEASSTGSTDVARMLLERGADAMAQDEHGSTPLHLASEEGHVEIVHMLERGADGMSLDKDGSTSRIGTR